MRAYLPEPFRSLLPLGLLREIVHANIPGLPGAIMSAGVKTGYLLTDASGQFTFAADWNPKDNRIHAVSKGGDGHVAEIGPVSGAWFAGSGGGGAAWASNVNCVFDPGFVADFTVAVTSGDTWFRDTGFLLADSGANGNPTVSGTSQGGAGGSVANSVGDERSAGGKGGNNGEVGSPGGSGARGGGTGGPHGDGLTGDAIPHGDAGEGGQYPGGDGVDGPSKGWAFPASVNAGSGAGGEPGAIVANPFSGFDALPGGPGGAYGGGGAGGGIATNGIGTVGAGYQGCILLVNNASA